MDAENRERRDNSLKNVEKTGGRPQMHELNVLTHDYLKSDFIPEILERMNNKKEKYGTA
jgi:hypothetical protein